MFDFLNSTVSWSFSALIGHVLAETSTFDVLEFDVESTHAALETISEYPDALS
jgi:hypothetical protein